MKGPQDGPYFLGLPCQPSPRPARWMNTRPLTQPVNLNLRDHPSKNGWGTWIRTTVSGVRVPYRSIRYNTKQHKITGKTGRWRERVAVPCCLLPPFFPLDSPKFPPRNDQGKTPSKGLAGYSVTSSPVGLAAHASMDGACGGMINTPKPRRALASSMICRASSSLMSSRLRTPTAACTCSTGR